MKIAGILRVKNEARWIGRVLDAISTLCDGGMFVLDDHSKDDTAKIALQHGAAVFPTPFSGFDEARDNQFLLDRVMKCANPDWLLRIDGDEELEGAEGVRTVAESGAALCYSLQSPFLWDTEDQVRVDRWYGDRWIPCLFSTRNIDLTYPALGIHTPRVPGTLDKSALRFAGARLIHYGYMDRADRLRKYEFYNRIDPGNEFEDRYRHIVQGDIPEVPADEKLKWAGPLQIERRAA